MKKTVFVLLAFMLIGMMSSCTKKSGCEYVTGNHAEGDYEYFKEAVNVGPTKKAHGILTFGDSNRIFTIGFKKSSIPMEYRKEGVKKHVRVSYADNFDITYDIVVEEPVYKLLCIEECE